MLGTKYYCKVPSVFEQNILKDVSKLNSLGGYVLPYL